MDRATAEDDLWWFLKRFTSFSTYRITELGHPMKGELFIDHPFAFWLCRRFQECYVEPQNGWVWFKIHRLGLKTNTLLGSFLWVHCRDASKTILLLTHKADEIGTGMGRGLLADLKTDRLMDYWPQIRNLQEGTKQGYVVDRPAGPREQSLTITGILSSMASSHPDIVALDDIVTDKLRGNVEQIARIKQNVSALAALMTPDCPTIVCNTPWDEADPLVQRENDGLFSRVFAQSATSGGDFTSAGEANLHTAKHYAARRTQINDDSIYFPQFELTFHKQSSILFDWRTMVEYTEDPEEIARKSPYINIIVDGAKGREDSDFTVIRVITWTSHDSWANLDLIRERVGSSKAMQILLGRDVTDPSSGWVEDMYCRNGAGIVDRWLSIDKDLVIWFDDSGNQGWYDTFKEMIRMRGIKFANGRKPSVRQIPEIHQGRGSTKAWKIGKLDIPYQQGKAAYPARGFRHGSHAGLTGPDDRDTLKQFRQDEFDRMQLGKLPPFDDMLDTESLCVLEQAVSVMRRPRKGGGAGFSYKGAEYVPCTVKNPFGIPGGGAPANQPTGKTWVSM